MEPFFRSQFLHGKPTQHFQKLQNDVNKLQEFKQTFIYTICARFTNLKKKIIDKTY